MDANSVVEALAALSKAGVEVWLDGGWGVDALLGEQTREHADLDLITNVEDRDKIEAVLLGLAYRLREAAHATNFVLERRSGEAIDVHPIRFDASGFGHFDLGDGRSWPFPPAAFEGKGRVLDRAVACLSPDAQVQCHGQGYTPAENDLRDMERLQERFGVVLPLQLCRPEGRQERE